MFVSSEGQSTFGHNKVSVPVVYQAINFRGDSSKTAETHPSLSLLIPGTTTATSAAATPSSSNSALVTGVASELPPGGNINDLPGDNDDSSRMLLDEEMEASRQALLDAPPPAVIVVPPPPARAASAAGDPSTGDEEKSSLRQEGEGSRRAGGEESSPRVEDHSTLARLQRENPGVEIVENVVRPSPVEERRRTQESGGVIAARVWAIRNAVELPQVQFLRGDMFFQSYVPNITHYHLSFCL